MSGVLVQGSEGVEDFDYCMVGWSSGILHTH